VGSVTQILITGGDGGLGRELAPRLRQAGHSVRIMSRRPRPADLDPAVGWATANLATGVGLAAALAGCEQVVHAASDPWGNTWAVDVDGTRALVQAAEAAGIRHCLHVSIVGIDRIPYAYYRAKAAGEAEVRAGHVPYSILRATQFHSLIESVWLARQRETKLVFLPNSFKYQTVDTGEVADRMVAILAGPPSGLLPDMGGPEVLSLGKMADVWFAAQDKRPLRLPMWVPGGFGSALRNAKNTCPDHRDGKIAWAEWVRRKYPR
jgi:uncharacterized protein YbjT (DUF2867 family)